MKYAFWTMIAAATLALTACGQPDTTTTSQAADTLAQSQGISVEPEPVIRETMTVRKDSTGYQAMCAVSPAACTVPLSTIQGAVNATCEALDYGTPADVLIIASLADDIEPEVVAATMFISGSEGCPWHDLEITAAVRDIDTLIGGY